MPSPPRPLVIVPALDADPLTGSGMHVEVVTRKRVAVDALCLSGVHRSRADPTQDVLPMRDDFEMVRVHAVAVAAEMVEMLFGLDLSSKQSPRDAVSKMQLTVDGQPPIAESVEFAPPDPASIGSL